MADRQTTGGYPRIGEVATIDLPLVAQLKPGGRMVLPVGPEDGDQLLVLVRKSDDGAGTVTRVLLPVRFVPLVRSR